MINKINTTNNTTLGLNIGRRPLSPLNKTNPNKLPPVPKTNTTPTKTPTNTIKKAQLSIKATTINTPRIPSPQGETENFEGINESELPTIGDISTVSTPSTISQEGVRPVEEMNTTIINET